MLIATSMVSFNRPELLRRTVDSYLATVSGPYKLLIVDNASDTPTKQLLHELENKQGIDVIHSKKNRYPGGATNLGWNMLTKFGPDLLHRSDNDMLYLEGWSDTLRDTFRTHPEWDQVSLRTDDEEMHQDAVGGNNAIRMRVWQAGVKYTWKGWDAVPWEDGVFNGRLREKGFCWGRVPTPCVVHIGGQNPNDPYYQETYRIRGIEKTLK